MFYLFFHVCISVLSINNASLVRGFIYIYKLLSLFKNMTKILLSCFFADLPPKMDVTDDLIGNRERLCINI